MSENWHIDVHTPASFLFASKMLITIQINPGEGTDYPFLIKQPVWDQQAPEKMLYITKY